MQEHIKKLKAIRATSENQVTIPLEVEAHHVFDKMLQVVNGEKWPVRIVLVMKIHKIFPKGRSLAKQPSMLNFIPHVISEGNHMAKLESEEAHKMADEWDRAIVIFVARAKSQTFHVQRYLKAQ